MGDDWTGQFDHLEDVAQVVYIPRGRIIGAREPLNRVPQQMQRLAVGF